MHPTDMGTAFEVVQDRLRTIIKSFLSHNDPAAAEADLKAIKMPFAHHELVKEGLLKVIEHTDRKAMILELFARFAQSGVVSSTQFEKGFWRVYGRLDDCRLDVPKAGEVYT